MVLDMFAVLQRMIKKLKCFNFYNVMMFQNGLKVEPYRNALQNRASDTELRRLTVYLLRLAEMDTLNGVDHSRWRE